MGFFSGAKSYSTSDSYSGLRTKEPGQQGAFNHLLSRTPRDFNFTVDRLRNRVDTNNPLGLNSQGFLPSQMEGINTFGRNLFNDVSSNYAGRGFLSPENVAGVIGSAVTQASPQLMSIAQANAFKNEDLQQGRFDQLNQALSMYGGLLGGQASSNQSQTSAGIGNTFGNSFASAFGKTLGSGGGGGGEDSGGTTAAMKMFCWIAEALYGKTDERTHKARWYVNTVLPLSELGRAFRAWYGANGQEVAALVPTHPELAASLRPLFDGFVEQADLMLAVER